MQALTPEEAKTLAASFSTISPDGTVAYAQINFATNADGSLNVAAADAKKIIDEVKAANGDQLRVGVQGSVLEFAGQEPPSSEGVGLIAAIIILLVAFGSVVAVGMPIVPALLGLTMGQMGVLLVANFMDVATFAPTLAAMIGLGVGIDYALFIVTRFRDNLHQGLSPEDSTVAAVDSSGRAVLFAGVTVMISLLGLFVVGLSFVRGLAVAGAIAVLSMMVASVTRSEEHTSELQSH